MEMRDHKKDRMPPDTAKGESEKKDMKDKLNDFIQDRHDASKYKHQVDVYGRQWTGWCLNVP